MLRRSASNRKDRCQTSASVQLPLPLAIGSGLVTLAPTILVVGCGMSMENNYSTSEYATENIVKAELADFDWRSKAEEGRDKVTSLVLPTL